MDSSESLTRRMSLFGSAYSAEMLKNQERAKDEVREPVAKAKEEPTEKKEFQTESKITETETAVLDDTKQHGVKGFQ